MYNLALDEDVIKLDREFPIKLPVDECHLSAEIYPMYYMPILRSSKLVVKFQSNCFKTTFYKQIFFDMSYGDNEYINWFFHPTQIYINLWSNVLRLQFNQARIVDRYDIMKSLEYRGCYLFNVLPDGKKIKTLETNQTILNP